MAVLLESSVTPARAANSQPVLAGLRPLGFTGLSGPSGVAIDHFGNVFLADTGNKRVLELSSGGTQHVLPFTGLGIPYGIALDAAGDV